MEAKTIAGITQTVEKSHCEKHGEFEQKVAVLSDGAVIRTSCQTCKTEEEEAKRPKSIILTDEERRAIRARDAQDEIEYKMRSAGIPDRFLDRTLENYIAEGEQQSIVLADCQQYVADFHINLRRGVCRIFSGRFGAGKTHLACGIGNALLSSGYSVLFMRALPAIRRIKDTYRKSSEATEQEVYETFCKPDLLILDEIGVQFGSDTEKQILFEIVNERYEKIKPTIIMTNLDLDTLRTYAGERVVDRLRENGGKFHAFTWVSHRGEATANYS